MLAISQRSIREERTGVALAIRLEHWQGGPFQRAGCPCSPVGAESAPDAPPQPYLFLVSRLNEGMPSRAKDFHSPRRRSAHVSFHEGQARTAGAGLFSAAGEAWLRLEKRSALPGET